VAPLALVQHVVKFDLQGLLSFDWLRARITSTKSRRSSQAAAVAFTHGQLRAVRSRRSEEPLRPRVSLFGLNNRRRSHPDSQT